MAESPVPGREEFQKIFQFKRVERGHRRRNVLLGIMIVLIVLSFFLLTIVEVNPPASSSGFGFGLYDVRTLGSPSYVLFGCGLVVTTGLEVFPPAFPGISGARVQEDQYQWICNI